MTAERFETYISVDLEASGRYPREYSILSIGACLVDAPDSGFYIELKPESDAADPQALAVSGLELDELQRTGVDPAEAMQRFADWLLSVVPDGRVPVFVAFNAVFDWMFIEDAFQRHLGRNPFGHSALDVKAYYMGMTGETWARTSMKYLSPRYLGGRHLTHNALNDARDQAELFRALLAEAEDRRRP